jgi:HlyD family secretion protein
MSRRLKIGCIVLIVLIASGIVIPLKFIRGRTVEVDTEAVERADIDETVTAVPVAGQPAGVVKPDEVKVIPKLGGELMALLVEEGDRVEQGQIVAYLDPRSLDSELRQARAATDAAQSRVASAAADLSATPKRVDASIDEARAGVDQAVANYRTALRGAREEEIERAREAAVQAEKSLEEAKADLATLERGARPEEIASAEAALEQAEAQEEVSRAQLELIQAGPRPEDVAQAQAALNEAESQLALRRKELDSQRKLAEGGYIAGNALKAAETAYEAALANRDAAKERLALAKSPYRPEEVRQAEADHRRAKAQVDRAEHDLKLVRNRTTPEELAAARARRDAAASRLKAARADLKLAENRTTPEELASAEASVRQAKATARRTEADRVTVRQREVQVAELQAGLRQAQAALDQAAERAGYTTINAPIDGIVTRINVEEGEYVQGGAVPLPSAEIAMLVITSTEGMWVEANIDEADIDKVEVDQEANIILRDNSELPGRVHQVSPSVRLAQGDVRTFAVEIAVEQPTRKLRSGMSVEVDVIVKSTKDAVSVPAFAVFEDKKGKEFVYLLEEGKAKKQAVTKGAEGIERVEITEGVELGDMVITSLEAKGLRDGAKVKVRKEEGEGEQAEEEAEDEEGPKGSVSVGVGE